MLVLFIFDHFTMIQRCLVLDVVSLLHFCVYFVSRIATLGLNLNISSNFAEAAAFLIVYGSYLV